MYLYFNIMCIYYVYGYIYSYIDKCIYTYMSIQAI